MRKKRRIFLCCLMTLLMAFVMAVPMSVSAAENVTDFEGLKSAVNSGGEIDLSNNIKVTETLNIENDTVINLNGFTLSSDEGVAWLANTKAVVTIKNGKIEASDCGVKASTGTLNLNSVSITAVGRAVAVYDSSTVNVDEETKLTTTGNDATVVVWGDKETNQSPILNVYGEINNTCDEGNFAIAGNGTDMSGTTININEGAKVVSENAPAIYHPQPGDITIDGMVEGITGIEIRAGNLTVKSNAVITATAENYDTQANGSGSTTEGAAISVVQHTTRLPINVSVYGGEITGEVALAANNLQTGDVKDVTVEVYAGAFEGQVENINTGGSMVIYGGAFTELNDDMINIEGDVAVIKADGEEITVIGEEVINAVLVQLEEDLSPEELAQLTVEFKKVSADSSYEVPVGVKVINSTDNAVMINGDELKAGEEKDIIEDVETPPVTDNTKPSQDINQSQTENNSQVTTTQNDASAQTGDDSHMGIVLIMMTLAAAVAVGAVTVKRKAN